MAIRNLWNWQQQDWPQFSYERGGLEPLEADFLRGSGIFIGSIKHAGEDDKRVLTIDLMSDEALNTSEIEGEILNRDILLSSIRRNFGLVTDGRRVPPAEQGIGEMMVDLYRHFGAPLSADLLFRWHQMLMNGRRDVTYPDSTSTFQFFTHQNLRRPPEHHEGLL